MAVSSWLYGFKVAILIATGFEQSEMVGPKKALEDAGATVHIVSPVEGKVQGWDWMALVPKDDFAVDVPLKQANANDYDALVLPGGLNSPDDLRLDDHAIAFVKGFADKPIAAICHGPWLLINAELVENKKVTSWFSIKVDLINAGAQWIDQPVVRDGNLITSRMPDDVPAFNAAMIALFAETLAQKKSTNN
jgi:protease I